MKDLSNWRSVRIWENGVERQLRQRHWLGLHGFCIGAIVLGVMWASAHLQLLIGSDSLALRYLVTLGIGYLAYLGVLRLWAQALVGQEHGHLDLPGDLPVPGWGHGLDSPTLPSFQTGGGGDFGGGGATGDLGGAAGSGDALGEAAGGVFEIAAGADEGVVVVVPVVAIFLIGCAMLFGAGSLLLLYFGWEALLAVAVELAFSYVSARAAVRVVREGWLSAAIRLTWKPLLGAIFCAVLLGGLLDYFVPAAQSLPHAVKLIRARG